MAKDTFKFLFLFLFLCVPSSPIMAIDGLVLLGLCGLLLPALRRLDTGVGLRLRLIDFPAALSSADAALRLMAILSVFTRLRICIRRSRMESEEASLLFLSPSTDTVYTQDNNIIRVNCNIVTSGNNIINSKLSEGGY